MLFSSRKPLYFVFHDRSERYFQDSTLQLTFSEWLWLTLRKRGYSNIYFVDLDDTGRPVLTLRDRDTWRGYNPGGIFSVIEEYRGRPLRRVMGDKEFLRLWNRIYDGPETVPMYFPRRHSHGLPPSAGQRTWMGCWTAWRGRSARTLLF